MSVIDIGNVVTSIWDAVKDHIPEKKQEDVAATILEALKKTDVVEDVNEFDLATGVDQRLDAAIKMVIEEYSETSYDDEDDYNEEYED